jgi:hypothetical protein
VDVAIALNLRQAEVTELYKEYWNLKNLHYLSQVYEEIKGDIHSFVNLYKLSKAADMNSQQVIRLLTIANNHLPLVEHRYHELKRQEASLQSSNDNSARTLKELFDLISTKRNTLEQYDSDCKKRGLEITKLQLQKIRLEALVDDFQDNNEGYIKIIKAVEEKVLNVLPNSKVFLRYALLSIIESITNNSERFRLIFYNIPPIIDCYDTNGQDYAASYMYGGQIQQRSQQYLSPNTEANATVIVDEAEKLYSKMIKDCINKTVQEIKITNEASDSKSLSLSLLPRKELPDVQEDSTQKPIRKEEEHMFIQTETDNES